ncbi:hypothetical protein M8C21_005714 [Ambrosia artemisiifolia]|uniref:Uncharacterized protein n=1 Tax=Ambrosia artemisiifolia TaxID=4212 RepID=A0AAD5GKS2_AMBAR|nr:hypothetical protein M8C21_005714 [Ambrosia artemisiifolia]
MKALKIGIVGNNVKELGSLEEAKITEELPCTNVVDVKLGWDNFLRKTSPRVDGDEIEEGTENEFNYTQENNKARRHCQGRDVDFFSSARHESQQVVPLLINGQQVRDDQ